MRSPFAAPAAPVPAALVVALTALVALAVPAEGHAILERSAPAAGEALAAAPRQVILRFSELLDRTFSGATVLDGQGRQIARGGPLAADPRELRVGLPELPPGRYTVRWRVLSAVDGHTTSGAFVFAVGEAVPAGLGGTAAAAPATGDVVPRWLAFLAAMLLVGSLHFQVLVLQGSLRGLDARTEAVAVAATGPPLRRLQAGAAAALVLATAANFVLTALSLGGGAVASLDLGRLSALLLTTKVGWSTVTLLTFSGLLLAYARVAAIRRLAPVDRAAAAAATVLPAGFTISSHASGSGWLAMVADWIHLLAAALWIGGLAALLLVVRALRAPREGETAPAATAAPPVMRRFSRTAGVCLGVLLLTGLYASWLHLPGIRALGETPYGRALAVKGLLILLLVALGAANHFLIRPRLEAGGGGTAPLRRLASLVGGELILGATILLAVAVLTITPPARSTLPQPPGEPLVLAGLAGDLTVRLTITPARPGLNRYTAEATTPAGEPVGGGDSRLLLRVKKLDENLTPVTVALQPEGLRHTAAGSELALPGWWELEVVVRRRGRLDRSTTFPLLLGERHPPTSDPAAAALLEEARRATRALRAWRETEQLTDGKGNVVVADYDLVPPDRLRYRTSAGTEAVIIGTTRFTRAGGGRWEVDTLPQAIAVEGPLLYMRGAERVALGRRERCDGEECQVVLWDLPSGSASFAAWVGATTRRVHRLLMVATAHFMTLRARDFNAPVVISAPP